MQFKLSSRPPHPGRQWYLPDTKMSLRLTWFAVLAITVEAVVMFRNVANLIKPVTECRIVITTQIFYTLMVFHVTDEAVLAVLVCIASTKVGTAAMSADWELIRAVLIRAAAYE